MNPTKDIHLRSLSRKLKCVQEDFKDVDKLSQEFDKDFQKAWQMALRNVRSKRSQSAFRDLLDEIANNESHARNKNGLKDDSDDSGEDSKASTASKSEKDLFRKITLETHPDRAGILGIEDEREKDKRKAMFVKAHEAYRKNDLETLLSIAIDLDLSLDDLEIEFEEIVQKVENLTQSIYNKMEAITNSLAWAWGTSSGDIEKRSHLIKMMLQRYGYYDIDDMLVKDIVAQHEENATRGHAKSRVKRRAGQRPRRIVK